MSRLSNSGLCSTRGSKSGRILIIAIVVFLLGWAGPAWGQHKLKDQDCLQCHSDATLTKDVNGKQASISVDGANLMHSVNGSMFACVDCHQEVSRVVPETRTM